MKLNTPIQCLLGGIIFVFLKPYDPDITLNYACCKLQ